MEAEHGVAMMTYSSGSSEIGLNDTEVSSVSSNSRRSGLDFELLHDMGLYSATEGDPTLLMTTTSSVGGGGSSTPGSVETRTLPIDMTFNDGHIVSIATYSVLLVISVCGNITVLVNLIRRRHISNPRVSIMLIHLAIADLLVSHALLLSRGTFILPSDFYSFNS